MRPHTKDFGSLFLRIDSVDQTVLEADGLIKE